MSDNKSLVPSFIIYFNGTRLEAARESEIKEIIVNDKLDSPSLFQIITSDPEKVWLSNTDYNEGAEVKIVLGYKDDLKPVILGEVTGVSCFFKQNQSDIVVIKGKNHLHRLCRNKRTAVFNRKTVKAIIETIAGAAGLSTDLENLSFEHTFMVQHNKTDYEYLLEIAKLYNCFFQVKDKKLVIKRLAKNSGEDLTLEYGKTLITFLPVTDTSRIVSEVEVRGWDLPNGEVLIGTATAGDIDCKAGAIVDDNWNGAKSIIIDHTVIDQDTADKRALDILTDNSHNYLYGEGTAEGNPGILAGKILKIEGLGKKFSSKYFITTARHLLKTAGGYQTEFSFTSTIASGNASGSSDSGSNQQKSNQNEQNKQKDQEKQEEENPQNQDWIEFKFVNEKTYEPIPNAKYTIEYEDGTKQSGQVDSEGKARIENLKKGKYSIIKED